MKVLLIENREQGFFSCFNLILYSINAISKFGVKDYYVKWNNTLYQTGNENLFDKYFWKQENIPTFEFIKYSVFDIYNSKVNERFKTANKEEKKLVEILVKNKFFENDLIKNIFNKSFKTFNCLGVQIRKTDHIFHGQLLEDEVYIKNIDKNLDEHSSIFLATDDKDVVKKFKNRYGNILNINENIERVSGKTGVHNSNFKDKEKLAVDVLTDAFSLSCCDKILITQSNISNYVKTINPNLKYEYLDTHIKYTNL